MTVLIGLLPLALAALTLLLLVLVAGIAWDALHPRRATAGWALAHGYPVHPSDCGWNAREEPWAGPLPAWCIEGGNPAGPVAVFVHGWRRSRIDSMRRAGAWLPSVRAAWLIDLAGHGDAPKGTTSLGAADVDAVARFCAGLAAREGTGAQVLLVGHSLGAAVALRSAALIPVERLAGVVAFAPYESVHEPIANRLRRQGIPAWPAAPLASALLHLACGRERSTRGAVRQLQAQRTPLLLVASDCDTHVPLRHVRTIAGPESAWVRIEHGASHDALGTDASMRYGLPPDWHGQSSASAVS